MKKYIVYWRDGPNDYGSKAFYDKKKAEDFADELYDDGYAVKVETVKED